MCINVCVCYSCRRCCCCCFLDVVITDISTIGEKKWKRALAKYEQILEPIYERISVILKSKLHTQFDNPKEIIQIFIKYETILKSVDIMEMLSAERQHFLQSLHGLIKDLKGSLSEPKNYADDAEISEICFETRELKRFQDEVSGNIFHSHRRFIFARLLARAPSPFHHFHPTPIHFAHTHTHHISNCQRSHWPL